VQTEVATVGRVTIDRIDPHGSVDGVAGADGAGLGESASAAAIKSGVMQVANYRWFIRRMPAAVRQIRVDRPNGSSVRRLATRATRRILRGDMLLEVGIVLLTIVCFVVLDLYVLGCEKV
jgi:hypothetical protein